MLILSSLSTPSLSQLREMESTRWQLAQRGERATITQEEQSALRKEIQEQEALLQGYQKVCKEGGGGRDCRGRVGEEGERKGEEMRCIPAMC